MAKALLVPYCADIPGFPIADEESVDLYLDGEVVATILGVTAGDKRVPSVIWCYGHGERGPKYSVVPFPDCMD